MQNIEKDTLETKLEDLIINSWESWELIRCRNLVNYWETMYPWNKVVSEYKKKLKNVNFAWEYIKVLRAISGKPLYMIAFDLAIIGYFFFYTLNLIALEEFELTNVLVAFLVMLIIRWAGLMILKYIDAIVFLTTLKEEDKNKWN